MEAKLLKGVLQTNTTARLQVADELLKFLLDEESSLDGFEDLDLLIGGLVSWLGSSHFKVSINSMEIIVLLCGKNKGLVKHHLSSILLVLRERLGDLKEQVRVHATQLFISIMDADLLASNVLLEDFLMPAFTHKNWRVKEEGMQCLTQVLAKYGTQGLGLSKFVACLCKLLEDPNPQVRTKSVETLVAIYKSVGEKVRADITKRGIPQAKLAPLLAKFDEVQESMQAQEQTDSSDVSLFGTLPRKKQGQSKTGVSSGAVAKVEASGSVGEDAFQKAFQDTPSVVVRSSRDLQSEITQIQTTLEDDRKNWEIRMQTLKKLRGIIKGGALEFEEFHQLVRGLDVALISSVKDLRSQICREACITISFMALYLKSSFEHIAEKLLTPLILLLPNAVKVMATSADVCIIFLIDNIHGPHLIPPITQAAKEAKSAISRKHCCRYIDIITHSWDVHILERHASTLETTISKGMADADAQARMFMRRAFWGFHGKFPSKGEHMFQMFDSQQQRHLMDEKNTHLEPAKLVKKNTMPALKKRSISSVASEPDLIKAVIGDGAMMNGPVQRGGLGSTSSTTLTDGTGGRSVQRQKRAKTPPTYTDRRILGRSQENLLEPRPSSKQEQVIPGFKRPSSSLGVHSVKRTGGSRLKPPGQHKSRSVNPSPSVSRESSPTRYGGIGGLQSYSRPGSRTPSHTRGMELTTEALLSITSQYGSLTRNRDDEDETGSVASVGSSFSMSSEMSTFSPHTKYSNPVQSVSELLVLCSSPQWSERRDGIAQVQLLLEGERPLTSSERNLIKEAFRRMLVETHVKVFSVFLDVLGLFITQYKEEMEDWLFKILLRLLHKKGTDMLSSVHKKLNHVLEVVRTTFNTSSQLHVMCQIIVDKAQPMSNKSKHAWLEYFVALVDQLEPGDFSNAPDTRQALSKIVTMATEPKSAEIRKLGKKTLVSLYKYNTSILTKMIQTFPQQLQDTAGVILKNYTQSLASSSDDSDSDSPVSSPVRKLPPSGSGRSTPSGRTKTPSVSPLIQRKFSNDPTSSNSSHHSRRISGGSTGSSGGSYASPQLKRSTQAMGSTPDMRAKTPSRGRTGIPTPTLRTPMSGTPRTSKSRPTTPSNSSAQRILRPKSTDPRRSYMPRPTSAKSDYVPGRYVNGQDSLMSQYALGRLSQLSYGDDSAEYEVDYVGRAVKQLTAADKNEELRIKALQTLLGLARNPDHCNWDEHSSRVLHKLMELMQDESGEVKILALRVFREVVKVKPDVLKNVTELVITKVLKSCQDKEAHKTAAEDVLPILAENVDPARALPQLIQVTSTEEYPEVLSSMKMMSIVITRCSKELLSSHLKDLMEGLLKLFGHAESTVRKSSVFCLVAVHKVVREDTDPYLSTLTTSQRKLLDIYIKKSQSSSSSSSSAS